METPRHVVSGYTKRGFCKARGEYVKGHTVKNCPACHALYARGWRKDHPLTEEQKKKDACRSYAHVYLKRGKIKRQPCAICGSDHAQMTHPDYNEPLLIVWLCKKCRKMKQNG